MMRAQEKTLQVALRLLTRAGLDASKAGETSSQSETWQISNSHTDQQGASIYSTPVLPVNLNTSV